MNFHHTSFAAIELYYDHYERTADRDTIDTDITFLI